MSGHETQSTGLIDVLIIQFLRKIECIKFECNEFVLVLVQIDQYILNIQFVLVQLELKLIQIR